MSKVSLALLVTLSLLLSGCLQYATFVKADHSGVSSGKVALWIFSDKQAEGLIEEAKHGLTDKQAKVIDSKCRTSDVTTMVSPIVLPWMTSFAKLGFDLMMDSRARSLDALKKQSQRTYLASRIVDATTWYRSACFGLVRYTKTEEAANPKAGKEAIGFIAIFQIIKVPPNAFRIQPVVVVMKDAVAVTKDGNSEEAAKVTVSYAIALKGIEQPTGNLPKVVAFGQGSVSMPALTFGPTALPHLCGDDVCPSSGLIPVVSNGPLEITFSVTESGNVGFDVDVAKAELSAVKAALGPALSTSLTKALED